ncbi:MAG: DUF3795 domain-containing protein [Spirochaetales bacterium]|nr:DUF3795 domain-containing protein [Spirochaetales bacterium]
MDKLNENTIQPKLKTAAVCGLFCPSCSLYIATKEEPARLELLIQNFGRPKEELQCEGCRSDKLSFYCRTCVMKKCTAERGFEFCSECGDYPCKDIKAFQEEMPHRAELWNSLEQIKAEGWKNWFAYMTAMTSCHKCGTINSAYEPVCRSCGGQPSSNYAEKHKDLIAAHINKLKKP